MKAFKQSICITVMTAIYFSNGFLGFSVVFLIINWLEILFFFNFDNKMTGNAHVLYPYLSRRQSYSATILLQCWRCPLRWDAHFYVTKSLTRRVKQDIAGQRVERTDGMYGDEHMYCIMHAHYYNVLHLVLHVYGSTHTISITPPL